MVLWKLVGTFVREIYHGKEIQILKVAFFALFYFKKMLLLRREAFARSVAKSNAGLFFAR